MIPNTLEIQKLKQLITDRLQLSKLQWFLVLFFSVVIFLSLGLGDHRSSVYTASIGPAKNSNGPVKVVIYGNRYENYLASGALRIPKTGWSVKTFSDSTTLTAVENARPLNIYSDIEQVVVGLLHYNKAGVAYLIDGNNNAKAIHLRSSLESVSTLTIGGDASNVQQSGSIIKHISIFKLIAAFAFILIILTLIASMQLKQPNVSTNQAIKVKLSEVVYFALPLFASTTIILLAYWPGNVAYDGSLQWGQALTRGNMDTTLGVTTTLFLRLFTNFSTCPAWVIFFQSLLSAIGVALILKELRYRGVPRMVAQIFAIALAVLPQYPTFFTNLGKDALSAVGIIFLAWSLLSVTRGIKAGRLNYFSLLVLISAAVFSGLMRFNVMPIAAFVTVLMAIFLFIHGWRIIALVLGVMFFVASLSVPKISILLSDEQQATKVAANEYQQITPKDKGLPLGIMANFYIYHLFSAAVHSGINLRTSDEEFFYRIAPRSAWANYDCYMSDTTFIGVSKGILLTQNEYAKFLKKHQLDLAAATFRIVKDNPSILIDRQLCISKMLWYVGYGQKPFQATTALGYDNVTNEFKSIVGENRTLLPAGIRAGIQRYFFVTEASPNFWFFWKPALILYIGLFCILFSSTVKRDSGLMLLLCLPLSLTIVMALVIPFPAYRYQYPATLIMFLLTTLAFAPAKK